MMISWLTDTFLLFVSVGMDGSVARLESIEPTVKGALLGADETNQSNNNSNSNSNNNPPALSVPAAGTKRKLDETTTAEVTTATTSTTATSTTAEATESKSETVADPVDWNLVQTQLQAFVGLPKADEVVKFLQQSENAVGVTTNKSGSSIDKKDNNKNNSNTIVKFVVVVVIGVLIKITTTLSTPIRMKIGPISLFSERFCYPGSQHHQPLLQRVHIQNGLYMVQGGKAPSP